MIHDQSSPMNQGPVFHLQEKYDGSICCYADDTTFTVTDSDHASLTTKLSGKYKSISDFMINNRLKLNDEKSHLLVISTSQARIRTQSCNLVEMRTPTGVLKPSHHEKLLGCLVQDNLRHGNSLWHRRHACETIRV